MKKTSKKKLLRIYFPELARSVPGWGLKPSSGRARALALISRRHPVFLEDGFLRSFGRSDQPLSIVADQQGIFYNARRPSDLEAHIKADLSPEDMARARRIAELWRTQRISKYNHLPDPKALPEAPYVLLMDQVAGDCSIPAGLAKARDFDRMLEAAMRLFPDCKIVIKTHPDVSAGKKLGHFDIDALAKHDQVEIRSAAEHPVDLISNAQAVFTVTSQTGFEALIHGVPVHTFGMPFYAGWGLTTDHLDTSTPEGFYAIQRRREVGLESLIHASLVLYPRYMDPSSFEPIEPEAAILLAGRYRRHLRTRAGEIHATGFSLWKRPILRSFLHPAKVTFHDTSETVPDNSTIALWGARDGEGLIRRGCKILRIEDGFIRSKGLGVELTAPSSWIVDDVGIYFDSRTPSRLEGILQGHDFEDEILAEGRRLRTRIISDGITKYNLSGQDWRRPPGDWHVILVPGQVESDASIKFGSPVIKTNLDLVKSVRQRCPDAYIVYKPHPDVLSGYRTRGETEGIIQEFCDEIVTHGSIAQMLEEVDSVHTLTSLTGFEALIRDINVTCYGQPFYSGWGLTTDIHPCRRRSRKRSLDELVSAALIEYPTYLSQKTKSMISPRAAIMEINSFRPGLMHKLPLRRHFIKWAALRSEKIKARES